MAAGDGERGELLLGAWFELSRGLEAGVGWLNLGVGVAAAEEVDGPDGATNAAGSVGLESTAPTGDAEATPACWEPLPHALIINATSNAPTFSLALVIVRRPRIASPYGMSPAIGVCALTSRPDD